MTRVCCIKTCGSGRGHNKKKTNRSFFEVPTDPVKRQHWLQNISPYLRESKSKKHLYVCDLHFKDDQDIEHNYKTLLSDGSYFHMNKKCIKLKKNSVEDILSKLPVTQQEAVRACFNAAKSNGPTGIRYANRWLLECILLRIKGRKSYKHIMKHKLLQLPTFDTLNKHMKKLKPSYGFQETVFDLLKAKASEMDPMSRRGVLVLDELKLSEGFKFDQTSLKFVGLVDLGKYTPESQVTTQGDHGLVFMFQPFCGSWVQTVGAFLSRGCATGNVLYHLVLECIILLENAGFFVDVVTTDGATWNKSMWKYFGLKGYENSCIHPCRNFNDDDNDDDDAAGKDADRLFFCSDYSHLHKLFRSFIIKLPVTWTPDGEVKLKHWQALLDTDGPGLNLKLAYKLTKDHLKPEYWQKMNCAMAYELFSERVASAMQVYKDAKVPGLEDSESTIEFIKRINKVIIAMTSRTPWEAMRPGNEHYKVIVDFRKYLQDWHDVAVENNYSFMSKTTYQGFLVTLQTTIDVMNFLSTKCEYKYLMTTRLNQDALEAFFGMIRSACGSTDHPDSVLFIQVYRLLSFYSLVKPPKGSNVEGMQVFEILFDSKHIDKESHENHSRWEKILDEFVKRGDNQPKQYDEKDEHDYNVQLSNEYVICYIAGFFTRKIDKIARCKDCVSTVIKSQGDLPRDAMIVQQNHGNLRFPSDKLFCLLNCLERAIITTADGGRLNVYDFFKIANRILHEQTSFVGCCIHEQSLTKAVINIYTVSRMHMIAKQYNSMNNTSRNKQKSYRKLSKLAEETNTNVENE